VRLYAPANYTPVADDNDPGAVPRYTQNWPVSQYLLDQGVRPVMRIARQDLNRAFCWHGQEMRWVDDGTGKRRPDLDLSTAKDNVDTLNAKAFAACAELAWPENINRYWPDAKVKGEPWIPIYLDIEDTTGGPFHVNVNASAADRDALGKRMRDAVMALRKANPHSLLWWYAGPPMLEPQQLLTITAVNRYREWPKRTSEFTSAVDSATISAYEPENADALWEAGFAKAIRRYREHYSYLPLTVFWKPTYEGTERAIELEKTKRRFGRFTAERVDNVVIFEAGPLTEGVRVNVDYAVGAQGVAGAAGVTKELKN